MPLSTTAKAVLCLCPPAMMAGTVATVPAAKRAVHHLTAHHAHAPRHLAARGAPAARTVAARPDCDPVSPAALPAVPLVTYAAPIPDEPGGASPAGDSSAPSGAIGTVSPAVVAATPLVSGAPGTSGTVPAVVAPVPEPATWLMIIGGAGALGMALRRRGKVDGRRGEARDRGRRLGARATLGSLLWSGGAGAEAGEMAAAAAVKSTVAGKTTAAGIAGKALLCACPAVVMAGGVMSVPPLRQAVHAATAAPAVPPAVQPVRPCENVVPVSAASVKGFPAAVTTVPAKPL